MERRGPDAVAERSSYDSTGRDTIARQGGYGFVISDAELAAAFPTAVDAAEAAVEFQLRILTERDTPGFEIGLGLHTGARARPARAHPLPA